MSKIYKDVLAGKLAPFDAKRKLHSEPESEEEVFVTPADVKAMLGKYIAGEVSDEQLSDWADFLVSEDVYVTPGWENDAQADRYEPMWEILQRLSTPFLDGPISKPRVEGYISKLNELAR